MKKVKIKNKWKKLALSGLSAGVILAAVTTYYEGTRYVPYQDTTGIWTNCQGNTHGVIPGKLMTPIECKGINAKNQNIAFAELHRYVKVPLNRNEAIAFADFIYNVGSNKFSTSTMLRKINKGNILGSCKELLRWVYAGGKKLKGLIYRRNAEYIICITPPNKKGL